jgi:hypothetical protein
MAKSAAALRIFDTGSPPCDPYETHEPRVISLTAALASKRVVEQLGQADSARGNIAL